MTTINYSWSLPIVGGNQNQWGTMLNNILTDIDAKMFARTGGAISGNVSVAGTLDSSGAAWLKNASATIGNSSGVGNNGAKLILNGWNGAGVNWQIDTAMLSGANELAFTPSTTAGGMTFTTPVFKLGSSGDLLPGTNGGPSLGSTALRWAQTWCTAGAFNTSDATLKTKVSKFNDAEIQAAIALSKEIGWFQWLDAVKEKGEEKARHHVGLTVQRAAEVLKSFGLDPWIFGFMSHDVWDDQITEHPAIEAVEAVLDEDGNEVTPAIEANDAWSEVTLKAGESYAFRYDQLNLFIARGIEARLAALEARA